MSHTSPVRYRQLFEYEKASHLKVLQSLTDASQTAGGSDRLQKAIDLMAHIMIARRLWLYRLGAAREAPTNFHQQNVSISDLRANIDEVHSIWSKYLENLNEAELSRIFDYRTTEGEPYRNSVEDILTQLYGHSLYHGGQIAYLLRESGSTPAETDFVFYVREPI